MGDAAPPPALPTDTKKGEMGNSLREFASMQGGNGSFLKRCGKIS